VSPSILDDACAVIGMSGRFPGSADLAAYWMNIQQGRRCITELPDKQADGRHVAARGVMDDIDGFDASFFSIPRGEARRLDPQHRLFLEATWHALEDAAVDPTRFDGDISVYGSCTPLSGWLDSPASSVAESYKEMLATTGDFIATRTSYLLGLTGESITVQTGCSSSLVTVTMACNSLNARQSDAAVVGAASVARDQSAGYDFEESMILSPDGHCRPFEERAAGTVPGAGCAAVVLRRLADAERDGDPIRAVIVGSAVNNDGHAKLGFTAPSVRGQARVIRTALARAGVSADSIGYVETHGTGTSLGDAVEFDALRRAFELDTDRTAYCALGGLKANFGHLDRTAGIAALVKNVLCLQHRTIPPLADFATPNPALRMAASPFYVPTEPAEWTSGSTPRRAGVSAFGIGGTNAHAILQEYAA
jgi:acyl transferase domain-containing protein